MCGIAGLVARGGRADLGRLHQMGLLLRHRGPDATRWRHWITSTGRRVDLLHTRLAIIRSGLPEPKIAPPVIVAAGVVLHPDLAYPELRIAIEYEGEEHRLDARRWRDDISRRRALEAAGWVVLRVTIEDLRRPSGFLADLTAVVRTRAHRALSS